MNLHQFGGVQTWAAAQAGQNLVGSDGDDVLIGGYGDDTLKGLGGDDYLDGGQGNDRIVGGAGDDGLTAGGGNDTLIGGAGFDTASVFVGAGAVVDLSGWSPGEAITINGGHDYRAHLTGVEKIMVTGLDGTQTMTGSAYADGLAGGGASQISGGGGDDTLVGGTGSLLMGDAGDDYISLGDPDGGAGQTTVDGGQGTDALSLIWESFEGRLHIHATADGYVGRVSGGVSFTATSVEGIDVLLDHAAATVVGGAGADFLMAMSHNGTSDFLKGGGGDDGLFGGGPNDTLLGGGGDDVIDGFYGSDTLDGGGGTDRFVYRQYVWDDPAQAVKVDASGFASDGSTMTITDEWGGVTTLSNFEGVEIRALYNDPYLIIGSNGDDAIFDGRQDDTIHAGAGDDTVYFFNAGGVDSDDAYDGGAGFDTVSYAYTYGDGAVTVDLEAGTATGSMSGADTLEGFEAVQGGSAGDTLLGSAASNELVGFQGDDMLVGRAGADTLVGGEGADSFVFQSVADSTGHASDLITDLEDGDVIDLSAIDADRTAAGNQAFVLVAELDGQAGQLAMRYDAARDRTVLTGDVDGDGRADLRILIAGDHTGFDNFVL